MPLRKAARYVGSQVRGTYRNTRTLIGSFTFDKILPNAIAGLIQEFIALLPKALGRGSPRQQVYASVTLIGFAVISTPISLGYSLIAAIPFAVTLVIGFWRLVPAVNERFRSARGSKLRDRDVPLWKRD
jgi:hypothetical protein